MACQNASQRTWMPPKDWAEWTEWLSLGLHGRCRWRLPLLLAGLLFARGRRTVTAWLRAAALQDRFRAYYYFISSVGRNTKTVAIRLLQLAIQHLPTGPRVLLALDDTPTKRYGPLVEGAGLHHNPTSGPDDHKFLYGHVWVTLAWVVRHPVWHVIGLPLLARLYVKRKDIAKLPSYYRWTFQTKLELGVEMVREIGGFFKQAGKTVWIVADGAYAYRNFLKPVVAAGFTVVSRLRKDAGLRSVPTPAEQPTRGRRKYGKHAISLAKRASQPGGWQSIECVLYGGKKTTKQYKTFLATYPVVGGLIRVVLVRESDGWEAFFCTDPEATVREILEAFADRSAIEQIFHDIKEIWGAGQQQVRNLWCNIGAFHLNLWSHTLVELWSWYRSHHSLCDRSASPWDDPTRRPSHADRRKALRLATIREELSRLLLSQVKNRKLKTYIKRLAQLAA